MPAIRAGRVEKSYGDVTAVDGVTLEVRRGETLGLLGPNGAGKTTTLHMLAGVLEPDAGTVELPGRGSPREPSVRRHIGVAPQALSLYDELTAAEHLAFYGRLYGLGGSELRERVEWGLAFAGLAPRRDDRIETFSGGMKRRLNLACGLVHDPDVLLLDEPTLGVDPQSRNHIFESIERLQREERTLLYTTHYMEEAERLCDRVAVMDRGRVLALDRVEALLDRYGAGTVVRAELEEPPEDPGALPGRVDGTSVRVETDDVVAAVRALEASGVPYRSLQVERPDLEAVFLALTGHELRD